MPGLSFTLPHWLYWVGLIGFPIIAMVLARRPAPKRKQYSSVLGYMILIAGGIISLHRFYLKSLLGLIYIPIFLVILVANTNEQAARNIESDVANQVRVAERTISREAPRVEEARASLAEYQSAFDEAEDGSFAKRSAERRLERAKGTIEKSGQKLAEAEQSLSEIGDALEEATGNLSLIHI